MHLRVSVVVFLLHREFLAFALMHRHGNWILPSIRHKYTKKLYYTVFTPDVVRQETIECIRTHNNSTFCRHRTTWTRCNTNELFQ